MKAEEREEADETGELVELRRGRNDGVTTMMMMVMMGMR